MFTFTKDNTIHSATHTNNQNNKPRNSGLTIKLCNTAKRTEHQALQHFLERQRNKVGGALLFFVASRDLWWGRARVLQNMVEWRVLQIWGRACV